MNDSFGLELVLSTLSVASPGDVVTAVVHWSVTSRGHLSFGNGDKWEDVSQVTELLPEGWNQDQSVYTLRYAKADGSDKMLLKVLAAGDILICSLLKVADNKSSDVTISPEEFINIEAKYPGIFKNKSALLGLIEKELLQPLAPPCQKENEKSQKKQKMEDMEDRNEGDPLMVGPRRPRLDPGYPGSAGMGPPQVGRSDLDPMGGMMGGGMLMDPRGGGRRMDPRYDPVGPSFPGRGRGGGMGGGPARSNFGDEMGPPGWDNMFM